VTLQIDDGLEFDPGASLAQVIREDDDYSGVRVTVPCRLATAAVDFHVDVNVGDPIWPGPTEVLIPRVLGGEPLRARGHPVPMVLAEKIVTALQRGTANTRWRDFVDVLALSRRHPMDARELSGAIRAVAEHRRATVQPLSGVLRGPPTPVPTDPDVRDSRIRLLGALGCTALGRTAVATAHTTEWLRDGTPGGRRWPGSRGTTYREGGTSPMSRAPSERSPSHRLRSCAALPGTTPEPARFR
jgi:hypothetical protein